MTATLVATIGRTDFDFDDLPRAIPSPEWVPAVHEQDRDEPNLRSWGHALGVLVERDGPRVVDGLVLPKLDPILSTLSEQGVAELTLVFVGTRQDPRSDFAHTDTCLTAEALARTGDVLCERAGMTCHAAYPYTMEGPPTDVSAIWTQSRELPLFLREAGATNVHLALTGGTPPAKTALRMRFWLAHDLDEFSAVREWSLQSRPGAPSTPVPADPLPVLDLSSGRAHVRRLVDAARFEELTALLQSEALYGQTRRQALTVLSHIGEYAMRLDTEAAFRAAGTRISEEYPSARHWLADTRPLLRACCFPAASDAPDRGALESLRPLMGLLLDILEVRWRQGEVLSALALVYLVKEYLPHLAWEEVLGHPADPVRLADDVRGTDWALDVRDDGGKCPLLDSAEREAREILERPWEQGSGDDWQKYLRNSYSRLGTVLQTCGGRTGFQPLSAWGRVSTRRCPNPCSFVPALDRQESTRLEAALNLAVAFSSSPVIKLRHQSPIGHFFGTPDEGEIDDAWREFIDGVKTMVANRQDQPDQRGQPWRVVGRWLPQLEAERDLPGRVAGIVDCVTTTPLERPGFVRGLQQQLRNVLSS